MTDPIKPRERHSPAEAASRARAVRIEDFNRELGVRLKSLDKGISISPEVVWEWLKQRSKQRRFQSR
jgi:hypothetical protein